MTLPSGTVHALGGGVLVAEVQTPSDTTFRVYDWVSEYQRPDRELHIDQAVACIDFADASPPPVLAVGDGERASETAFYRIDVFDAKGPRDGVGFEAGRMTVVMAIGGAGRLVGAGDVVELSAGTTVLVPAASACDARLESSDGLEALIVTLGA